MYTISKAGRKITGTDDGGRTVILFDSTDVYRNKSQIPLRTIEKAPDGRVKVREIIPEAVFGRSDEYKRITGSEIDACCFVIIDFLLADHLITLSRPVLTAFINAGEAEKKIVRNSIGWFDADNLFFEVPLSEEYKGLRQNGFDMILLRGEGRIAEEELRRALYLMADDCLILMLTEDPVFIKIAELFFDNVTDICVDNEHHILKIKGRKNLRSWCMEPVLYEEYKVICRKVSEVMESDKNDPENEACKLRDILAEINELIKVSRKQYDFCYKQRLLDFKEAVQDYMVNLDDPYRPCYEKKVRDMFPL